MHVRISSEQLHSDSVVVRADAGPKIHPWKKPLPPLLYKYYPPERLHVLTDCLVRFSQRAVFDDQRDLRPEVSNFGTADEIRAFMDVDPILSLYSAQLKEAVIKYVLSTPGKEQALIGQAQGWLTAPEEFGVFCLCENNRSRRMWYRYAAHGKGFVVAFDTMHTAFEKLRNPGLIGKIDYSDEQIPSFLSAYGASAFFRKRAKYAFEAEWRSVRALKRFSNVVHSQDSPAAYLAAFDPSCIKEIQVLEQCVVEWQIRTLMAIDCRYSHARVRRIESR